MELQRLLSDIKTMPNITMLIVHKIDRLARNREDDIAINMALKKAGVQLVSCSEKIEDTPSGMLFYGLMAEMAQFYSANLAQEVTKGMVQKAKLGGTPGLAPIGYLNVRTPNGRRDLRSVIVDPERGPLVSWCFEEFASGEWSGSRLLGEAGRRGLRTRSGSALRINMIYKVLNNPYYLGVVSFQGIDYQGSHEPLVSPEVFVKVQEILASHVSAGEKGTVHHHYLKGTIFCSSCGSRICFTRSAGNGGRYDYFYCAERQRNGVCPMKYIRVHIIEEAVALYYKDMEIEPERIDAVRQLMEEELAAAQAKAPAEEERLQKLIVRWKGEQARLLQAHYADAVPVELMKEEMARITASIAETTELIAVNATRADGSQDALTRGLALAEAIPAQYRQATPMNRRRLNQGIFRQIFIGVDGQIDGVEMTEPFETANRRLSDALIESSLPPAPGEDMREVRVDAVHSGLAPIRSPLSPTAPNPGVRIRPSGLDPVEFERMIGEAADLLDQSRSE